VKRLLAEACWNGAGSINPLPAGGAVQIRRPSGRQPYVFLVSPVRLRDFPLGLRRPAAVAFVTDSESQLGDSSLLRQTYGLTPTQARVALLLAQGLRVNDIVTHLDISAATVRTHVRGVLAKTAARGQADLVRILISGPLAMRNRPTD